MRLNPEALASAGLGIIGILYAAGKKPPEWLTIAAFIYSAVALARDTSNIFIDETIIEEPAPAPDLLFQPDTTIR